MFNEVTNDQMLQDCFKIRKEVFVKEQHVQKTMKLINMKTRQYILLVTTKIIYQLLRHAYEC